MKTAATVPTAVPVAGLIAASAHGAKNALSVALEQLEALEQQLGHDPALHQQAGAIRASVDRVNGELVRLLMLYKLGGEHYTPDLQLQEIYALIEDAALAYQPVLEARGIAVSIDCDPDLAAYADGGLVGGMLADALHNACRYARRQISISAGPHDGGISLTIEDDGPGLDRTARAHASQKAGSNTGLGTAFGQLVAGMHRRGERAGSVRLDNHSRLGGARWTLILP